LQIRRGEYVACEINCKERCPGIIHIKDVATIRKQNKRCSERKGRIGLKSSRSQRADEWDKTYWKNKRSMTEHIDEAEPSILRQVAQIEGSDSQEVGDLICAVMCHWQSMTDETIAALKNLKKRDRSLSCDANTKSN
jgi:hypothetical protein